MSAACCWPQKAYVEGGLSLSLYCSRLLDEEMTNPDPDARAEAKRLLDILTPIAKAGLPSGVWRPTALAIQVHGGYGYTREYNVEQLYRDNRLNPIHEGTHGIQGWISSAAKPCRTVARDSCSC